MSSKMPTVTKTINFKEDLYRLKQISLEMKRTLVKAQLERSKSAVQVDGESYNQIMSDFQKFQASKDNSGNKVEKGTGVDVSF